MNVISASALITSFAIVGCASVASSENERYELTSQPLHPTNLIVTDRRPPTDRAPRSFDKGFYVGDSKISPEPTAYIASEIAKLCATDAAFAPIATALGTSSISIVKFNVGTQAPAVKARPNPAPGVQAVDYAIQSLGAWIDPELVVELELEIAGSRYATTVTWPRKWDPPSQATVFPASFAVRTVLNQYKAATVAR